MKAIREAICRALADDQPMTVRQVFYRLTSAGVIAKTETEYGTVKRLTAELRRDGKIPYEWLADATRWMRKPTTTARSRRRSARPPRRIGVTSGTTAPST